MPEPKSKSEQYANMGGVNRKISPYITPDNQMLTVENLDFRIQGALTTTAGTTAFSSFSVTSPITGLGDYFSTSATFGYGGITYSFIATTNYAACDVTGTTFLSVYNFLYPNNPTPFCMVRNQYLFGTNGWDFFEYRGGTQGYQFSLPPPIMATYGIAGITGTVPLPALAISITLSIYFAYIRNDGMIGPATLGYSSFPYDPTFGWTAIDFQLPRFNPNVGITNGVSFGSFGISGILYWFERTQDGTDFIGITTAFSGMGYSAAISGATLLILPPNQTSFTSKAFDFGVVLSDALALGINPEEYLGTFTYGPSLQTSVPNYAGVTGPAVEFPLYSGQFNPTTISVYNNQLFSSGFYYYPDTVWYSNVGELEKRDFENSFEVRANDGDIVSCMISYYTQLIIFKLNSIHALSGTDPDNFVLTEVTAEYGCLNMRSACVWEQNLWFLDKTGIGYFNGANTKIVSDPVDYYFKRMNVEAARTQATMIHVKELTEIWCAIPIDGATYNNIVIIFDYATPQGAWRTRTVDKPTAMAKLSRGINKEIVYQGSFSGSITSYGTSFFTDTGTAFTSVIKSRFHAPYGHSEETQFRRLYIDAVVPPGQTMVFPINFYANQGTTPRLSTTLVLTSFQNHIEFGIAARDLSFELFYNQGQFLQFNGYTLEYRLQRLVGGNAT